MGETPDAPAGCPDSIADVSENAHRDQNGISLFCDGKCAVVITTTTDRITTHIDLYVIHVVQPNVLRPEIHGSIL